MPTKKKENIKPETYPRRRATFFDRMEDGAALIPTAHESTRPDGQPYPFRPDMDFYYLTGLDEPSCAALFLKDGADRSFILFVRPENEEAETWTGPMTGIEGAQSEYGADEAYPVDQLEEKLVEFLAGRRRLYFPFARYDQADQVVRSALHTLREAPRNRKPPPEEILGLSDLLHRERLLKSPEEIELHRRAIEITWKGFMRVMKTCEPGRFEYELEALLEETFRRRGGDGPAFETIVGGGTNAAILHYSDNEDRLNEGDLVLIDAGASYQYHCADITRTIPVSGEFTPVQRTFYNHVLSCQKEIIDMIEPGVTYGELQRKTEERLAEAMIDLDLLERSVDELLQRNEDSEPEPSEPEASPPFKQFFMHKIGHWLGLDVHDRGPYRKHGVEDSEWEPLEPGMLLTIEPGLYVSEKAQDVPEELRGTGVRIEDDVLVTEEGCEVLTSAVPKEPEKLEEVTS